MYRSGTTKQSAGNAHCTECGSKTILYQRGSLLCRDCGHTIYKATRRNKYNASKTIAKDGIRRDSKFEASVADELYILQAAGEILAYDSQYRVEMNIYNKDGKIVDVVKHKVDFRLHLPDGSYKLLEAKGIETDDYKWRRRLLLNVWLPEHPDHVYEVRKQR